MIDQLRIKCPSCGIILDVRNSKHEAVKRIVCPNCHKQLAIDFQEEEKPIPTSEPLEPLFNGTMRIDLHEGINQIPVSGCEHIEIKVVRLNDGKNKCLVRPIDGSHNVLINGQQMQAEDQVALAKGDLLQIDDTTLVYGIARTSHSSPPPVVPTVLPAKNHPFSWLYAALSCAVLSIAVILIWHSNTSTSPVTDFSSMTIDTVIQNKVPQDTPIVIKEKKEITKKKDANKKKEIETKHDVSKLDDYTLEQLARGGDVDAQYELGNRLIRQHGSNKVIIGIHYLRMAADNGSTKAQNLLSKAVSALRQKASEGDSTAYNILKSIQ